MLFQAASAMPSTVLPHRRKPLLPQPHFAVKIVGKLGNCGFAAAPFAHFGGGLVVLFAVDAHAVDVAVEHILFAIGSVAANQNVIIAHIHNHDLMPERMPRRGHKADFAVLGEFLAFFKGFKCAV